MLHVQRTVRDWDRCLQFLPDKSLVKAVDEASIFPKVKATNPNIYTMLRHAGGTQNVFGGDLEHNKQIAREFLRTFIDGTFLEKYAKYTDLVQEWNEYLASSHSGQELADRITWAEAVASVWFNEYRPMPAINRNGNPIRLALVNAPIGNDIHPRFAEIAIQYDCVLSYHAYSHFVGLNERDPLDFQYHSGRWNEMEKQWGNLKPDWVFGEAGPYAGVVDGWRSDKVLGGNREAYVEAVRAFIRDVQQTDAYKQGRLYGFGLFTTGRTSGGWDEYYTEQPELDMLAQMIGEEWAPGDEPIDPGDPDPEQREYARKVWLAPQLTTSSAYDGIKDVALPLKNTITFSVDDAFIDHPNLTKRIVNVLEVNEIAGSRSALEEWVKTHYPPLPGEINYMTFQDLFLAKRWDSPVGTPTERASDKLWPGNWVDATGFMTKYTLGYHTGADLNLNDPVWDYDRNMPLYPAADGLVVYAGTPSSAWQGVVVVRHVEPSGNVMYTRYAHMAQILVKAGQWVKRHVNLGTIGRNYLPSSGEWGPFHLHFDISNTSILDAEPGYWPGDNAQGVLDNFVDPLNFILGRRAV